MPWYIRLAWHSRLIKLKFGNVTINDLKAWELDNYIKYFGYHEDDIKSRFPLEELTKGFKITIPF